VAEQGYDRAGNDPQQDVKQIETTREHQPQNEQNAKGEKKVGTEYFVTGVWGFFASGGIAVPWLHLLSSSTVLDLEWRGACIGTANNCAQNVFSLQASQANERQPLVVYIESNAGRRWVSSRQKIRTRRRFSEKLCVSRHQVRASISRVDQTNSRPVRIFSILQMQSRSCQPNFGFFFTKQTCGDTITWKS
jgi:hypothetical protein